MSIPRNPDRSLSEGITDRLPDRPSADTRISREPTRVIVRQEKRDFIERSQKRSKWSWKKIAALAIGAYALYHFRFWMREKLHLAFSKVPQNAIEANMSTTAIAGGPNRPLPGNAERQGTNTGESAAGPIQ